MGKLVTAIYESQIDRSAFHNNQILLFQLALTNHNRRNASGLQPSTRKQILKIIASLKNPRADQRPFPSAAIFQLL